MIDFKTFCEIMANGPGGEGGSLTPQYKTYKPPHPEFSGPPPSGPGKKPMGEMPPPGKNPQAGPMVQDNVVEEAHNVEAALVGIGDAIGRLSERPEDGGEGAPTSKYPQYKEIVIQLHRLQSQLGEMFKPLQVQLRKYYSSQKPDKFDPSDYDVS